LFEDKRAVGVEVEGGGEVFTIAGKEIVLSSGGVRSPHLLMLSGVGPEDQLREAGIPLVHKLPGVGKNLKSHPAASINMKAKEGIPLGSVALEGGGKIPPKTT
jgi:choline dehydrogenase